MIEQRVDDELRDSDIFAILAAEGINHKQKVYGFELLLDRLSSDTHSKFSLFPIPREEDLKKCLVSIVSSNENNCEPRVYLSYTNNVPVLAVRYFN